MPRRPRTKKQRPIEDIIRDVAWLPKHLQFFTYEEVALIFKVTIGTVRQWVYSGQIDKTVALGHQPRISMAELEKFAEARSRSADQRKHFRQPKGYAVNPKQFNKLETNTNEPQTTAIPQVDGDSPQEDRVPAAEINSQTQES